MTPSTPYLIRGLYDWILDNSMTPYLAVDTSSSSIDLPVSETENGRIVLNIAPNAVRNLVIGNTSIEFRARFSGVEHNLYFPVSSVLAIYSKECGSGMSFDNSPWDPDSGSDPETLSRSSSIPSLRVVK